VTQLAILLILNLSEKMLGRDFSDDSHTDSFTPLKTMPTDRLQDVMRDLTSKQLSVVNLDALIPGSSDSKLLKTLLFSVTPSVRTLSLRFNNFKSADLTEALIDWISTNDTIENLYLMGSHLDDKSRSKIEAAWKKHLVGHRIETYGFSFFRINKQNAFIPPYLGK
jgi:hypothetical protein